MPAIIPAIAGFAFSAGASAGMLGATMASFAAIGGGIVGGAMIGAVAGAVVGGLQSLIMGGDIGDGILYGAVGGAVGGALGGAFAASDFGVGLLGDTGSVGNVSFVGGVAPETIMPAGTKVALGSAAKEAAAAGVLGLSGEAQGALVTGGMGLLQGFGGPDEVDQDEVDRQNEIDQKYKLEQIAASKGNFAPSQAAEVARINASQSDKESLLNAKLTREKFASEESSLAAQLAQQKAEMNKPYEEAAAKRARILETAQGFSVKRKGSGGQPSTEDTTKIDDTPNYIA